MNGKTCFFIGHRDSRAEVYPRLVAEVERHIKQFGVREFYVGYYGAFDAMAARAVLWAKEKYSNVRLFLLLPYHPAVRRVEAPAGFDGSYFPAGQETAPPRLALLRANEHMVHVCDCLIACVTHPSSGSSKILELALNRQKRGLIRVTCLPVQE